MPSFKTNWASSDTILAVSAAFFVIADIILALCLGLVLPYHITRCGYYSANGKEVSFEEAKNMCPCLVNVFPLGTKHKIKMKAIPKVKVKQVKKSIESKERHLTSTEPPLDMDKYPFLVALNAPRHSHEVFLYVCTGVVVSEDWLLASDKCVESSKMWKTLQVRSRSPYWSEGGITHKVELFKPRDDFKLMELMVHPKFTKDVLPNPPIKYPYNGSWIDAVSMGWFHVAAGRRFEVEKWSIRTNTTNYTICNDYCTENNARPLLTRKNELILITWSDQQFCTEYNGNKTVGTIGC